MNLHMKTMMATTVAVCLVTATPVYALENGAFTTSTTTNYINPDTGTTDDGGTQNAAIGEGMCRSIIDPTILIEVDNGKVYATARVHLYGNMPSVGLKIQGTKGDPNSYYAVSHSVMQEDFYDDFADLRFEIPNVGTRIQCTAYVTPMGREVCFYFDIASTLTAYSGNDFIVSVDTTAKTVEEVVEEVAEDVETVEEVAEVAEEVEAEEVETETEVEAEVEEEVAEDVEAEEEEIEEDVAEDVDAEAEEIEEIEEVEAEVEEEIAVMSITEEEDFPETAPGIEARTMPEPEEVSTIVEATEVKKSSSSWIAILAGVVVALGVILAKKRKA